jgi:crotonobetainyl-CoA:carnitine CoA-transferase CaiB-like acyl-CoA transferase
MKVGEVRHPERARFGKPLEGVRVLALEQMQALPYATQLLAHLGAEVVKVEPPGTGETGRFSRPALVDEDGREVGATYLRNNLSKRSITVDLKEEAGRELIKRLIPHFDVVAENFRAGVMERFGLDYESVAALDPRAIYLSVSGFGRLEETPYAAWPAYAPIAEAMSGLYEPNRKEGEPPPVVVAGALGDISSALFAVIGVLSALRHRERTGLGQCVDVAMLDSMVAVSDMPPFMWSMGAPPWMAAAGKFAICAGFEASDGWFVIGVFREHQFERFANLLGHPEWVGDPRFATREGWAQQIEPTLRPALEGWAADKTRLEACRLLGEAGIPAGPSNRPEDLAADPHVAARGMLIEVPRPDSDDPMLVVGNPVKLSKVAEGPVGSFPRLGADTDAVLRETLGLSKAEIASLRERGVIT